MDGDKPGAYEQVTREKVMALELQIAKAIDALTENIKGLWTAVEAMRKDMNHRLPAWYTFLLSGSWTLIGAMSMYIVEHILK